MDQGERPPLNMDLPEAVASAAQTGDIDAVKAWLAAGGAPDAIRPNGDTLLNYASMSSRPSCRFQGASLVTSGAFLMGMAFHADLNKDVVSDTLWAVAAYLEVLALIPALVAARAGQPQSLEFARAIALCRVFSLAFWSQAFAELKARSGSSLVGVVVLAVETIAVVLAVELLAASSPKGRNKKD